MNQPNRVHARVRHYLHGDPVEGNPESFYCQRCDLFVERGHFATCELDNVVIRGLRWRETHEWRYVTARRRWLRTFEPGDTRRIVDDPGNVFRTGTASEQALPVLEQTDPGDFVPEDGE